MFSNKNKSTIFNLIVLLFSFSLFVFSCKDPDDIGLSIQPSGDKLNVFFNDSSKILAYTVLETPLRTDETSLSMLGCYADPLFGKASSSFYTEFALGSSNVSLGSGLILDSIVLTITSKGGYGKNDLPQTVRVFELSQNMS